MRPFPEHCSSDHTPEVPRGTAEVLEQYHSSTNAGIRRDTRASLTGQRLSAAGLPEPSNEKDPRISLTGQRLSAAGLGKPGREPVSTRLTGSAVGMTNSHAPTGSVAAGVCACA
jgi:hypothetical protein